MYHLKASGMKRNVHYIIPAQTFFALSSTVCECVFIFLFSLILRTGGLVNRTTTTIKSTVRKVAFIMDASGTIVIVKPTITGFARYQ